MSRCASDKLYAKKGTSPAQHCNAVTSHAAYWYSGRLLQLQYQLVAWPAAGLPGIDDERQVCQGVHQSQQQPDSTRDFA